MNERMGRFVVAYMECGNARAAAVTAGYSESYARGHAYKLLKHPKVVRALESGVVPDEWAPCSVTDVRAKEILSAIVLATPEVFVDEGGHFDVENGGVFRHAIREFTMTEDASSRPVVKVKFWDKLRALRELRRWNEEERRGQEVDGQAGRRTDKTTDSGVGFELGSGDCEWGNVGRSEGTGKWEEGGQVVRSTPTSSGRLCPVEESGVRSCSEAAGAGPEGASCSRENTDAAEHRPTDNTTDSGVGFELGSGDSESEDVGRPEEPVVLERKGGSLRLGEEDRALLNADQVAAIGERAASLQSLSPEELLARQQAEIDRAVARTLESEARKSGERG